jgi:Disulphide bond corrector protein DsbC
MKIITTIIMGLIALHATAQDPVHWKYEAKKVKDKTYEVHFTATMDEGWHVYSQTQPKEAVAQPTKISFVKNPLVTMAGKAQEVGKKETFEDKVVGIKQYHYGKTVDFVQVVTLKGSVKTNLAGNLTWQACTDEMCLPAKTVEFNIPIGN